MHGYDTYDYGARGYYAAMGRFTSVDPLAEKYYSISPYAYCNNNPVNYIDKNGKEGTRTTDKDGNKIIESNVVVLVDKKHEIPKNATDKQIAKIEKQNARIEKHNAERVESVNNNLNQTYNGADRKGSKNSAGENVIFKFNITAIATNNTDGGESSAITKLALANGLPTSDPLNKTAAAAIVTMRSAGGALGLSNGVWVTESAGAPSYTIPHEIGHTFHLDDNFPESNGGLMDYPPGQLVPNDVDNIWNKAYDK